MNYILRARDHFLQILCQFVCSKIYEAPNFTLDQLRFQYFKNCMQFLITKKKGIIFTNASAA